MEALASIAPLAAVVAASLIALVGFISCLCCGVPAVRVLGQCLFGCPSSGCCKSEDSTVGEQTCEGGGYALVPMDGDLEHDSRDLTSFEATWMPPLLAFQCSLSTTSQKTSKLVFHDRWAAVLLLTNVTVMITIAASFLRFHGLELVNFLFTVVLGDVLAFLGPQFPVVCAYSILFVCLLASLLGFALLTVLIKYPEQMVRSFFVGVGVFVTTAGLVSFAVFGTKSWPVCAVCSVLMLYLVRLYRVSAKKIPFSCAVISVAATAVKMNYAGVVMATLLICALLALWLSSCAVAYVGISQYYSVIEGKEVPVYVSVWVLCCMFWVTQTLKSILHCTISGVVGSWWFQPGASGSVRGSLFRSSIVHLGPLCFGAVFIAVVQTVHEVISSVLNRKQKRYRRSDYSVGSILSCLVSKLLSCFEEGLRYFNRYTVCYVAGYGTSLLSGGSMVTDLFRKKLVS
jgi:hypothetical protein